MSKSTESISSVNFQSPTIQSTDNLLDAPKVYKRRFWMLVLYTVLSVWIGMMYPEYSSMANVTECYYNVTSDAVAWTNSASNLIYSVLVFPATSVMEAIDLKWTLIVGAALNVVASAVQFLTLARNSFAVVLTSIFFSSVASVTVLGTPPILASKWFPDHEQSRACAVGVAGYQLGMSMGSLFPLVISNDCNSPGLIEEGKWIVSIYLTAVNTLLLFLVIFTFQNNPPSPPNHHIAELDSNKYSIKLILKLIRNKDFVIIITVNAIYVGVFCAVLATLNNLVLKFFPNSEVDIGWMGFLLTLAGIMEGFVVGYVLDRTRKYKEAAIVTAAMCFGFFALFSCMLYIEHMWIQYLTIFLLGSSIAGTLTLGYEYLIEVMYPNSEILCANVFTGVGLMIAVIFTQIATNLLDNFGPIYSNLFLICPLILSGILTYFISTDYKRCKSAKTRKEKHMNGS